MALYSRSAPYYDREYSFKNYQLETDMLLARLDAHGGPSGGRLLDVACGSGRHLEYLRQRYECEGLDACPELLEAARQRNPGVTFHSGDMAGFELETRFDVVTCLFSSIGYMKTIPDLEGALARMARHLSPGGALAVEPWFTPQTWRPHTVHSLFIDEPELKVARISTSFAEGRLSWFDLHYLVGTHRGTEHFVERHEMGLFEIGEMIAAFTKAGLEARYDAHGLTGRGLYIAKRRA